MSLCKSVRLLLWVQTNFSEKHAREIWPEDCYNPAQDMNHFFAKFTAYDSNLLLFYQSLSDDNQDRFLRDIVKLYDARYSGVTVIQLD